MSLHISTGGSHSGPLRRFWALRFVTDLELFLVDFRFNSCSEALFTAEWLWFFPPQVERVGRRDADPRILDAGIDFTESFLPPDWIDRI